ncbi:DUF4149 domain-containing protein [Bacteroidota bacterium]|jgi:hypothetical protein|nr:DUF4149 domain-containing protein [Bacteroidota bacterium]|tara:strand:- start:986 stop:1375 length:390 start_codon:yes stop_codon:yes gene_type:complete
MFDSISIFISGLISGMILFQTSVIAPSVFKTLSEEGASPFLRSIFPKLFLIILVLGAFQSVISVIQASITLTIIGFITFISMLIAYLIVPATNKARDENDEKSFKRLHLTSVILTVIVLLANIAVIFIN